MIKHSMQHDGEIAIPQPLVTATLERLGGEPVFAGTRVPVQAMFDYLEAGDPLDRFIEHFPDVSRAHALAVLKRAKSALISAEMATAA